MCVYVFKKSFKIIYTVNNCFNDSNIMRVIYTYIDNDLFYFKL